MKLTLTTLTLTMAIILSIRVQAQQLPESNLYTNNKYAINPAYAGYKGCLEAYASHLSQWVGLDAAPVTDYLYVHTDLGKNMGIGGGIILDKATHINRSSAKLSYAYKVKFKHKHNIRFGLTGMVNQISIDLKSVTVDDISDDVINSGEQSGTTIGAEFGIFYTYKKLQLGLAIPQIIESKTQLNLKGLDGFINTRHLIGYAEYNWKINKTWNIVPSVLYKTVQVKVSQIDINTLVTYNDLISFGIGYRTHIGPLARIGLNVKEKILVAYAYEFAGIQIPGYSNGSHEIMLGFKLCNNKHSESIPEILKNPVSYIKVRKEVEKNQDKQDEKVIEKIEIEEVIEIPLNVIKQFKKIYFESAKSNINEDGKIELKKMAEYLLERPKLKIKIMAHTDNDGYHEENMSLSKARTNSVAYFLISSGVSEERIKREYFGETKPIKPNVNDVNKALNRRTEYILFDH